MAYLVLRIGGPKLLHVLHATHGLPAPRSVQSHTRTDSYISAAVDTSFENRIIQNKNNGTFNETSDSIKTLKMDEIATESRLRWCSKDNKIIVLCYQHSHDINISLNTLDDALKINDLLDSDRIHKTKETLVLTYGVVGNGGSVQTILTLPSCSKTESDQFSCMIDATCKSLNPDIIATDGDAMRRKLFNGRNKVILDRDWI